jgi:predicted nucleic acid-binding protein
MAAFYIDSSALVKRYVAETGSGWLIQLADPTTGHDLYTVTLTAPEVIAAVARRARGGHLAMPLATVALRNFRADWQTQYQAIEPDAAIIDRAMDIAQTHALRGYDAVHVATAVELWRRRQASALPPLTFISADQEQLHVAAGEGLAVDDPNRHI